MSEAVTPAAQNVRPGYANSSKGCPEKSAAAVSKSPDDLLRRRSGGKLSSKSKRHFAVLDSFAIRMAFDKFCRTNGINNGGADQWPLMNLQIKQRHSL